MVSESRRGFFAHFFDEAAALVERAHGRQSLKLSRFATLSDEMMAEVVLSPIRGSMVAVRGFDYVDASVADAPIPLFRIDTKEEDVWCNVDGERSLREIAGYLQAHWGEDIATAFRDVRSIAEGFVRRQICVPLNCPEPAAP